MVDRPRLRRRVLTVVPRTGPGILPHPNKTREEALAAMLGVTVLCVLARLAITRPGLSARPRPRYAPSMTVNGAWWWPGFAWA